MINFEREFENTPLIECPTCEGSGGWNISQDREVYDEWKECIRCNGEGFIEEEELDDWPIYR